MSAGTAAFLIVVGLLFVAVFAFWLWMLIDCVKRKFSDKLIWILIMLLTGIIGSIIYYFVVKRNDKPKRKKREALE